MGRSSPLKGRLTQKRPSTGHTLTVSSCCVPTLVHFSSLQPPGPSQTRACSERVEGGAFLHVQALGRQAPAQASVVLGPPNPGVRQDGEQRSVPFDASLAAAPEGSGLGPRDRTLGEKQHFSSCVCLCESVCCRLWGLVLSFRPPRANSRGRCCLLAPGLSWDGKYLQTGHTTDVTLTCLRGQAEESRTPCHKPQLWLGSGQTRGSGLG